MRLLPGYVSPLDQVLMNLEDCEFLLSPKTGSPVAIVDCLHAPSDPAFVPLLHTIASVGQLRPQVYVKLHMLLTLTPQGQKYAFGATPDWNKLIACAGIDRNGLAAFTRETISRYDLFIENGESPPYGVDAYVRVEPKAPGHWFDMVLTGKYDRRAPALEHARADLGECVQHKALYFAPREALQDDLSNLAGFGGNPDYPLGKGSHKPIKAMLNAFRGEVAHYHALRARELESFQAAERVRWETLRGKRSQKSAGD